MQPIPSFVTVKGPEADEARKLPAPVRRNTPNPVAQALLNGDMIWLPVDTRRAQQLSQTVKKRGMRVHVRPAERGGGIRDLSLGRQEQRVGSIGASHDGR